MSEKPEMTFDELRKLAQSYKILLEEYQTLKKHLYTEEDKVMLVGRTYGVLCQVSLELAKEIITSRMASANKELKELASKLGITHVD